MGGAEASLVGGLGSLWVSEPAFQIKTALAECDLTEDDMRVTRVEPVLTMVSLHFK